MIIHMLLTHIKENQIYFLKINHENFNFTDTKLLNFSMKSATVQSSKKLSYLNTKNMRCFLHKPRQT